MNTSSIHVLLVDDDEEEYLLAQRYLSRARTGAFPVTWAPSFDAALEELESAKHDICLLDYQLGERTGIDLLKEMRARNHDLPVILLTGHGSLELDLAAMELGAFDYIEKKDITPALLERSIRYTIADHRARMALRASNEELERRVQERTNELNRSNRELEQFAQMVASDLREPLRELNKQIETLKRREVPSEPRQEAAVLRRLVDSIHFSIQNMELLIQSVLDCSQVGRESRTLEAVELHDAWNDACQDLQELIEETGARLEVGELPTVRGDRMLLRGLFRNLLDNALKFRTHEPPVVRVWSERKGDAWLVGVRDNGVGLEPHEVGDLFLMFHRGSRHAHGEGIGLGLAICRKIVQYHGGKIWVDSEPGKGATFFMSFPAL